MRLISYQLFWATACAHRLWRLHWVAPTASIAIRHSGDYIRHSGLNCLLPANNHTLVRFSPRNALSGIQESTLNRKRTCKMKLIEKKPFLDKSDPQISSIKYLTFLRHYGYLRLDPFKIQFFHVCRSPDVGVVSSY